MKKSAAYLANRRINLPTKSDLGQYLIADHAVNTGEIVVSRRVRIPFVLIDNSGSYSTTPCQCQQSDSSGDVIDCDC